MPKADVFVSVVAVLRSYARFLPAFVDEVYRTLRWDHGDGLVLRGRSRLPVIAGPARD